MVGYFDVRPKDNPHFLYGRDRELKEFISQISKGRWIAVLGPRRVGKTSLVLCGLRNLSNEYVCEIIDFRTFAGRKDIQPSEIIQVMLEGFNNIVSERKKFSKVIKGLGELEEFELDTRLFRLRLKKGPAAEIRPDIILMLDKLNSECRKHNFRLVLGFDEAQELVGVVGIDFISILAHIFDYCKNIQIVLTGSKFGLLKEILEPDHTSPLYGRYIHPIRIKPFEKPNSKKFLELGFNENKIKLYRIHLEEVVNTIDGIPGWLTYFGSYATSKYQKSPLPEEAIRKSLRATLIHGEKVVIDELENFLKNRKAKERFRGILEILALRETSWSKIKRGLQIDLGKPIDSKNLSDLLKTLLEEEFVTKVNDDYKIIDPILKEALG